MIVTTSRQLPFLTQKSLGHKKWQVTYIAPLNHVPLLCSHPGGLAGAGRIRLAAAKVIGK
jgi:hypothetical protein